MASEMTLDGYDAILARLSNIEEDMQNRVSRLALKAGAKEIQVAISEEVNVSHYAYSDHIRDDIQVGRPKRNDTGWSITIGPGEKTAWRAKFLEFGHSKPGGGSVPAYPFMEPGLKRSQSAFQRAVADVVRQELQP